MGRGREGVLKERKENERSFSVLCEQLVFWELLSDGGCEGGGCDVSTLLCQPNGTAATAGGLCVREHAANLNATATEAFRYKTLPQSKKQSQTVVRDAGYLQISCYETVTTATSTPLGLVS